MSLDATILVFPQSYPYSAAAEDSFLEPELQYLRERFSEVVILPTQCDGSRATPPSGVRVDTAFAKYIAAHKRSGIRMARLLVWTLTSSLLINELIRRPQTVFQWSALHRLILYVAGAQLTSRWTRTFLETSYKARRPIVLYSYWLSFIATGLGRLRQHFPNVVCISRAHGIDFQEFRFSPPYIPCRLSTLRLLDHVFFASCDGEMYMKHTYPTFTDKFSTATLGVDNDSRITNTPSADGVMRIVSCSSLIPLKRVSCIVEALAAAARINSGQQWQWDHFGTGTDEPVIRNLAATLPINLRITLHGQTPNKQILHFYETHPVDLFVSMSSSEGGRPVSIMEALSRGIPVIAPARGGMKEIVSDDVGILLHEDATASDLQIALQSLAHDGQGRGMRRQNAYKSWEECYNAATAFRSFADWIAAHARTNEGTLS